MRRTLFLLLGLAAVVGLTVSSSGFTSVSADRGVGVDVVGDESAYMAMEYAGSGDGSSGNGNSNVGNGDTGHRHGQGASPGHSHGEGFDDYHSHGNSQHSKTVSGGEEITFVTVTNQFAETVTVTVYYDIVGDEVVESSRTETTELGVGEEFDGTVEFECQSNGKYDATVLFNAEADGDSVFAETTNPRQVGYQVKCTGVNEGNGNSTE